MDIDTSDIVLVKLTPYALNVMSETHFMRFHNKQYFPPFLAPEKDEDGWSRMELWRLMREFGAVMRMGNPDRCFEGNVVRLLGAG